MPADSDQAPDVLPVTQDVRLRRFDPTLADDGLLSRLLVWYQDPETVRLVDGPEADVYDPDKLLLMFRYMNDHGELYLIERCCNERRCHDHWLPIGDVGLQAEAIPIVLSAEHRRQGIGRAVIKTLIGRARELGWRSVQVSDIYSYNVASRRLFESLGFVVVGDTENGHRYRLALS